MKLGPRTGGLYELLDRAAEVAHEAARKAEIRFSEYPSSSVSQEDIKAIEHEGDRVAAELITYLNEQLFIAIDRADVFVLGGALDDVTDAIENACELLGLYGVEGPTRYALEQCRLLVAATAEIRSLIADLHRLRGSAPQIAEIKRLEDEGDRIKRDAVASLFKDDRIDPLIVVRWKDVYEALEEAIDACETVAHRVGNLLVKHH